MKRTDFRELLVSLAAVPLSLVALGCTANLSSGTSDDPAVGEGGLDGVIDPNVPLEEEAGTRPLRRLNARYYRNSVQDILGVTVELKSLSAEGYGASGFRSMGLVSEVVLEEMIAIAEDAASQAVARIDTLAPCSEADERVCARDFIEWLLLRAMRRPPTADEVKTWLTLYDDVRADPALGYDYPDAIRVVIQATLLSPEFLYLWEEPNGPQLTTDSSKEIIQLSDYEIASRLSYFLLGTIPDEALFSAAESGQLRDPQQLETHARRLLELPRAKESVASFFAQWLRIESVDQLQRSPYAFPDFDSGMAAAMGEETRLFVEHVFFEDDARLQTFFSASYSFVGEDLAPLYGLSVEPGSAPTRVELPSDERYGIFTQPSVLAVTSNASETSPIHRGLFIREQLLCQHPPAPPMNIPELEPVSPDVSGRARFEQHSTDPACASCHALTDPIGFAFEHYDAIGEHRETDRGLAIDPSGELVHVDGKSQAFADLGELVEHLLASIEVQQCVIKQWLRFGLGRHEEDADAGSVQRAYWTLRDSDLALEEMIVRLVTSKTFTHRRLSPGEELQE